MQLHNNFYFVFCVKFNNATIVLGSDLTTRKLMKYYEKKKYSKTVFSTLKKIWKKNN